MKRTKRFTVSDGHLVLVLEPAEEGGYIVTSPLDPQLVTEAETLEKAFVNVADAAQALRESRAKLFRQIHRQTLAQAPVPRHSQLKRGTVRTICRLLGIPLP